MHGEAKCGGKHGRTEWLPSWQTGCTGTRDRTKTRLLRAFPGNLFPTRAHLITHSVRIPWINLLIKSELVRFIDLS